MPEEEVFIRGEQVVTGLKKALPEIHEAGKRMGEALAASVRALRVVGRSLPVK